MTLRKMLPAAPVILLMGLLSTSAQASGAWTWATETAMSKFTAGDLEALGEAGREALQNHADGESTTWSNPETGHRGSVTVNNTRELNDTTCRDVLLQNEAGSLRGTAQYLLCLQPDDTWKITFDQ